MCRLSHTSNCMNYAMLTIRRIYRNSSLDCFIYRKSVRASFLIVVETGAAVIHQECCLHGMFQNKYTRNRTILKQIFRCMMTKFTSIAMHWWSVLLNCSK